MLVNIAQYNVLCKHICTFVRAVAHYIERYNLGVEMKSIGKKIKGLRASAKITQDFLASEASVSRTALQLFEKGEGNPTIETLAAIAGVLNVQTGDLFEISKITTSELVALLSPIFELAHVNPKLRQLVLVLITGDVSFWDTLSEPQRRHAQALLKAL